jgi:hypothetical protein
VDHGHRNNQTLYSLPTTRQLIFYTAFDQKTNGFGSTGLVKTLHCCIAQAVEASNFLQYDHVWRTMA